MKSNQDLNAEIVILNQKVATLENKKENIDFFSSTLIQQKERFINILSLYLNEISKQKIESNELQKTIQMMDLQASKL